MNQNKPSDMEKVEVEFEFYGFTLDELKKECKLKKHNGKK